MGSCTEDTPSQGFPSEQQGENIPWRGNSTSKGVKMCLENGKSMLLGWMGERGVVGEANW